MTIDFGSSPDRTDELVKRVFTEVDAFKAEGPTDKQVADAKEGFVRDHETNITSNNYLLSQIAMKYEFGEANEVGVLFDLPAWYQRLTGASIQAAARQYLNTEPVREGVAVPGKALAGVGFSAIIGDWR